MTRKKIPAGVLFAAAMSLLAVGEMSPPMGWSSWNTFRLTVDEGIIKSSAVTMAQTGLKAAGYEFILIDDGWTHCDALQPPPHDTACAKPGPRDPNGNLQVNRTKFPSGFKSLTDYVHSLGLKIGIYTSVSAVTCGGFTGSLNHEEIDAKWFASMGFDLVKHDTCGSDCSIHTGCMQNATQQMGSTLRAEGAVLGREIIYYLDHGNPINPQLMYNPHNRYVEDTECLVKLATKPEELVWLWTKAPWGPHVFKSWFDRHDSWMSMLSNVHNQIRVAEWHSCGHFHTPDMPTCGQGNLSISECRAEFALYTILGAPLILGCDIRNQPPAVMDIFTNREMLEVLRDPDCVQGSLADNIQGAAEVWTRPLSDGTFAAVLLNKGTSAQNVSLHFGHNSWNYLNSFYPAEFNVAEIRNIFSMRSEGTFTYHFTALVPPHDALLLRLTPTSEMALI
mmetsp:Transcript_72642/g.188575  ORF Transcript_72642/g.188575 Transcript_72642/m.188575 type:complete len:449 (-) Transcript_72642:37-1383(-)